MGNSSSIPNCQAAIRTKDGKKFTISYHSLVEHILLLRKVIHNPEMTTEGPVLNYYIRDYCKRMAKQEMRTKEQQLKLPWQIEWIWHVHRLHPLAYLNDCKNQLEGGLVHKKVRKFINKSNKKEKAKRSFSLILSHLLFVPSIDLKKAVIRQKDFLDKFQKHVFYSHKLQELDESYFQNLIQNYVLFIKLARQNQLIVPTFEIALIWHTDMRFPSHYHELSIGLCGFILDHDDSIESNALSDGYQKTADRWRETYSSEYGQDIDHARLRASQVISSNAVVFVPITIDSTYYSDCDGSSYASGGIKREGYRGGGAGGEADDGYADGGGCGECEGG